MSASILGVNTNTTNDTARHQKRAQVTCALRTADAIHTKTYLVVRINMAFFFANCCASHT